MADNIVLKEVSIILEQLKQPHSKSMIHNMIWLNFWFKTNCMVTMVHSSPNCMVTWYRVDHCHANMVGPIWYGMTKLCGDIVTVGHWQGTMATMVTWYTVDHCVDLIYWRSTSSCYSLWKYENMNIINNKYALRKHSPGQDNKTIKFKYKQSILQTWKQEQTKP